MQSDQREIFYSNQHFPSLCVLFTTCIWLIIRLRHGVLISISFSVLFKNLPFSSRFNLVRWVSFTVLFVFFIFSPPFCLPYLLLLCFHWTLKHLPFSIRSQLIERNFQSNQHLVLLFSSKKCFHYCVLYWILILHLVPVKNMIIKYWWQNWHIAAAMEIYKMRSSRRYKFMRQ